MKEAITENESRQQMIKQGLTAALPLVLSYVPVAITFGVLAQEAGLTLVETLLMSVLVYAGAAQFMGVNMIAVGSSAVEIIVATFVLNFRHFIMSFSFMNQLRAFSLYQKAPLTLGLTDETFAVSAIHKEKSQQKHGLIFYTTVILASYISWIIGTLIGGLIGEIIPPQLSESMGIALYAMFIGLLIPMVKTEIRIGLIAILAMLINLLAGQFVTEGWAIVIGTIAGGFSGIFLLKENES